MSEQVVVGQGDGTTIWTLFQDGLAVRGYDVKDFPEGAPSAAVYVAWQRRSFTTIPSKLQEAASDAVKALLAITHKSYARCSCGEPIHEHEMHAGLIAEIVRNGKHRLIHYDSCQQPGDALA